MLTWMAWTWPAALFFIFIGLGIVIIGVSHVLWPSTGPRKGVFFIKTTRGDRLFISLLGGCCIMLGWLGWYGTPLWGGLLIAVAWLVFVFVKV